MSSHTHYEVLGLPQDASLDDIKKRYRELVRRFHPDVAKTGNAVRFKAIQTAYDVLSDTTQRTAYDSELTLAKKNAQASAQTAGAANSTQSTQSSQAPPPPPPNAPQGGVGSVIAGKYRIVREIARSNDVVYEATDTAMGRRVAVKELVIPPNLVGQARRERIERFNREARAAGKLSHPNIVTIYDYGEDNGRYFIAMEYLEGGTLRDRMQAQGALTIPEATEIASQILSALAHSHANQVVHRDIKPDNMHILPGGQVKLTDFGIARLTEEASMTGEGQVFGTPSYMSPEQIKGRYIDHRSDLFSLGILLYEMLAGRKPFTGDSVISITYAIMENQPPPLAGLPYGLEQVIFRALDKDPNRRFRSAEDMRHELKNADMAPPLFNPGLGAPTSMGGLNGGLAGGYGGTGGYTAGMGGGYTAGMGGGLNGGLNGGYNGASGHVPYGNPAPLGVSIPPPAPMGSMGSGALSSTVYSPAPVNAAPTTQGQGPFANWNPNAANGGGVPGGYSPPPPPFPRQSGPVMSEATRTFFMVLVLAVVLGGALLGGILLFQRAYDQQKKTGAALAIESLNAEGEKLYNGGSYDAAIEKYKEAFSKGKGTPAGDLAKNNLVVVYNKAGLVAFQKNENRKAEDYWFAALDVDPNNEDANYNLNKLYERIGDKDQALREWRQGSGAGNGRITSPDPTTPGNNSVLQNRAQNAMTFYNQGMDAWKQGEQDKARDLWTKAIGEAPGTEGAQKAKQALEDTINQPNFGG